MGFFSNNGKEDKKGYDKKDAAKDTGCSVKEVAGAWHNARNDAVGTEYEGRSEKKDYANNKK